MTVAVTGANGHIGANLVRSLIADGQSTRSLVHVNRQAIEGLDTELVSGDVCDIDSLCRAFRDVEIVYHLAACISLSMRDWPVLESINVAGTRNVVEACIRTGVRRLVHFSSIHALVQEPLSKPVDESRPLVASLICPPYDRSKADAEREIYRGIEKGLDAVIINPTAIIGPHDYEPSYLGEALLMIAGHKLPSLVGGGYDWVDVRDVVEGAKRAAEKAPSGARYLLSGHWASIKDLAGMVSEIVGIRSPRFTSPLWLARIGVPFFRVVSMITKKRPLYTAVSLRALHSNHNISHEKATRELGYQPRPFRDTVIDTLEWFRADKQLDFPAVTASGESI